MEAMDLMPSGHEIGFKIGPSSPLFYVSMASMIILIW